MATTTTAADRALAFIKAHPGSTFSEIHAAIHPGSSSPYGTTRATRRLVERGLIRKQRDGKKVRHYPL